MDTKYLRKIISSTVNGLAILVLVFSVTGTVSAQEHYPWFTVFPEQGVVEGWDWPLGAVIHMTIDDPGTLDVSPDYWQDGSMVVNPWEPDSSVAWLWIDFSEDYSIKPGDVVTLSLKTDGTMASTHEVQNLSISDINPTENTVFGTTSEMQVVTLWSWEDPDGRRIETDGSANWGVDFDDIQFDLEPGYHVRAEAWVGSNDTAVDWEVPEPQLETWRDEFDGSLADEWDWINENENKWEIADSFLRIYTSIFGTGGENLLLRPVAEGDFAIETHLFFTPDTNFQFAGLVIWENETNFVQFGRAFCDIEGACVGNGIYFDKVLNGESPDPNFATQVDNPFDLAEAYLRLERRGEMIRAFYSHEGVTWFEIGTHWIPAGFQVNGVGLTSSQDFSTDEWDVPADFDYFELTEGWGFLPEGHHDYDSGDFPSADCNLSVGGWAADPDDLETDLMIEVGVYDTSFNLVAGDYRGDLDEAGVCVDGNCAFQAPLDFPPLYQTVSVIVYAQDIPSGEWVRLSASPKEITCRTYDIYTYDSATGEIRQITNLPDTLEYNPSWSPNGKKIAHDVVAVDYSWHSIFITDVATGESVPLIGAEDGGNDAAWSPNGKWIAFDKSGAGNTTLYIVESTGGDPIFEWADAVSADWAPNSRYLVFQQPSDASIWIIPFDGGRGEPRLVADAGANPDWSPDGKWIAYENDGDIWKVQVNAQGMVFGDPIQVTSGPFGDGQPTWSADSATIVYHSGFTADYDLWVISSDGGEPTWLNGAVGFGDYDPAYAKKGSLIAYASFSPNGQAPRTWVSAYSYDAGTWDAGQHTYQFWTEGAPNGAEFAFDVSNDAPSYDGYVLIRPNFVLRAQILDGCIDVGSINPTQETRFHVGWTFDGIYADAPSYYDNLHVQVRWDTSDPTDMFRHEIFPYSPYDDWYGYTCAFTAP